MDLGLFPLLPPSSKSHQHQPDRLTNTRVEQLVAIRANLRLFEPENEPSSTRLESDSENEASESELDIEEVQGEDIEA